MSAATMSAAAMSAAAMSERYLLCRAGGYPIAVRTQAIKRIWPMDAATHPSRAQEAIDLRALLEPIPIKWNRMRSRLIGTNRLDIKEVEHVLAGKSLPTFPGHALGDGAHADSGVAVAFDIPEKPVILIVDGIGGMAQIAEAEFLDLPHVFGFARRLFDAACKSGFEGGHPLRLRSYAELSASMSGAQAVPSPL